MFTPLYIDFLISSAFSSKYPRVFSHFGASGFTNTESTLVDMGFFGGFFS